MSTPKETVPTQPTNVEAYIGRIKKRASPTADLAEDINETRMDRIKSLVMETKMKQLEADARGLTSSDRNITNTIKDLFATKSVEEINKFLSELTPEVFAGLQKIATLGSGASGPIIVKEVSEQKSGMSDKIMEALLAKALQEKKDNTPELITAIAALIKSNDKPQPAPQQQQSTMDTIKILNEIQKPLYDRMTVAERNAQDARMKELEAKMPPDLKDQIAYIKEVGPLMGLGKSGANELDLKLEEMRQNREVDMKKLEWEKEKYGIDQDNEAHKWDQVAHILEGPLGDVIKSVGNAGADRVRGPKGNRNNGGKMPKPVQTQCPQCKGNIFVDADADTAICGNCGSVLQKQGVAPPPAPQPPTTTRTTTTTTVEEQQPSQEPTEDEQRPTAQEMGEEETIPAESDETSNKPE